MVIATHWDKKAIEKLFYPTKRQEMLEWIEKCTKEGYRIEIRCFNRNIE